LCSFRAGFGNVFEVDVVDVVVVAFFAVVNVVDVVDVVLRVAPAFGCDELPHAASTSAAQTRPMKNLNLGIAVPDASTPSR
jgi:hypothetical protein